MVAFAQVVSFVAQIGASYLLGRFTAQSAQKATDLEVQNGDYGVPMPRVYGGAVRLAARFMAQAPIKERQHVVQDYSEVAGAITGAATGFMIGGPVGAVVGAVGGFLFGSAAPKQKYYTYSDTFALLIADRTGDDPIEGVGKIWASGRVIFDANEQGHVSQVLDGGRLVSRTWGQNRYFKSLRVYGGGFAQGVDPVLAAALGEDSGYLGSSYLVIEDLQLADFGNSVPNDIEVLVAAKTGQTLADTAELICAAGGVDHEKNLSTTALTSMVVRGYAVEREVTCWDALSPLMPAFRADASDVGGQVHFYARERGVRATIPLVEMGAHEYGNDAPERINYTRAEDLNLPRETSLTFVDPERDYQPNTATSRRSEGSGKSNIATTLALTLTADEGATAAATLHWDAWLGRTAVSTTLSDAWSTLTPAIVFGIPFESEVLPYRLTRKLRGVNGINEVEFLSAENVAFQGVVAGGSGNIPPPETTLSADTRIALIDMPILSDGHDDFGYYVAMAGTAASWPRGAVQVSEDAVTFGTIIDGEGSTVIGDISGVLPVGPTSGWDDTLDTVTVLTVVLLHDGMALQSASDEQLDSWANFAFVGKHGQGEYLQFKTAEKVAPRTWELTDLRRGRRGTDWAMATHASGEEFVLLGNDGIYRMVFVDDTNWGNELVFRGVTLHQDPLEADTVLFTNTGEGKKPFSPIHLQGSFDIGGDLTLTWEGRPRFYQAGFGTDAPESYEVDIFRNGVLKRTITVAVEEALYSAAEQASDGFSPGDPILVRVYQVNTDYGRGHMRERGFPQEAFYLLLEDGATPFLLEDGVTIMELG